MKYTPHSNCVGNILYNKLISIFNLKSNSQLLSYSYDDFWSGNVNNSITPKSFYDYFEFLKDLYSKEDCTNLAVLAEQFFVILNICEQRPHPEHLLECGKYQYKVAVATAAEFIFVEKYTASHQFFVPELDIVRFTFVSGNIGLLNKLIQFGATMLMPQDSRAEFENIRTVLTMLFLFRSIKSFRIFNKSTFIDNLLQKIDPTSRRRVHIVMRGIEILSKIRLQPNHAPKYRKCLRLVFRSIPEPKIRSKEIKETLQKLLEGSFEDNLTEKLVDEVTKEYEDHFPESAEPTGPRSLKRLSCIQIRDHLRGQGSFSHRINELDLPKPIEDYILLKENHVSEDDEVTFIQPTTYLNPGPADVYFPMIL